MPFIFRTQQAAVERKKEDASREEQEQIGRWSNTLAKVLDLRCDGVTDEAVWTEVGDGWWWPETRVRARVYSEII